MDSLIVFLSLIIIKMCCFLKLIFIYFELNTPKTTSKNTNNKPLIKYRQEFIYLNHDMYMYIYVYYVYLELLKTYIMYNIMYVPWY